MKKSTKITISSLALVALLGIIIGGIVMSDRFELKEKFAQFVQETQATADKKKADAKKAKEKKAKMSTKEKQLAYLKDHEQEIVDFVKSQNSKIESVQIDWTDVRWGEAGNGTPQGGGEIVNIYGRFNNIENSGWNVMMEIDNGQVEIDTMSLVNYLSIGGKRFD